MDKMRRSRRDFIALYNSLKRGCDEVEVKTIKNNRRRGNGLKLHKGRFKLDFLSERAVMH